MKKTLIVITLLTLIGCGKEPTPAPITNVTEESPVTNVIGTVFEFVEACPNINSVYPKQVLIRISKNLFTIERQGSNSFLAAKPPGHYVSVDAIGCNYVINTDGTITN